MIPIVEKRNDKKPKFFHTKIPINKKIIEVIIEVPLILVSPQYPANPPIRMPNKVEMPTDTNPTAIEIVVPSKILENTSLPKESVPNRQIPKRGISFEDKILELGKDNGGFSLSGNLI